MTNTQTDIPDWIRLNNETVDENLELKDIDKDKEATRAYFTQYVNKNTQYFGNLDERIRYMVKDNNYWEDGFLDQYTREEIQAVFDLTYSYKFRFPSFIGAYKFYNDYSLRTNDRKTFLERYEDRLAITALYHSDGDVEKAKRIAVSLINQDFTPATPTLLNSGRAKRGELVSCFLMSVNDSLNSISRANEFSMQLSK